MHSEDVIWNILWMYTLIVNVVTTKPEYGPLQTSIDWKEIMLWLHINAVLIMHLVSGYVSSDRSKPFELFLFLLISKTTCVSKLFSSSSFLYGTLSEQLTTSTVWCVSAIKTCKDHPLPVSVWPNNQREDELVAAFHVTSPSCWCWWIGHKRDFSLF